MSIYTKRLLFIVPCLLLVGLIGAYNETAQRLLGLFAFGWMVSDIAQTVFPEGK